MSKTIAVFGAGPGMGRSVAPADLADAMWDLYLRRDRFDQVFGA